MKHQPDSMEIKPRVFCGSSSESLRVVQDIKSQLDDTATVVLWKGFIKLGEYALEKLLAEVDIFDFGIFVFAADDMVDSRGQRFLAARDNVVLELGLFMERLGRGRTFLVVQEMDPPLHLPSDLLGLTTARFSLPAEFSQPSEKTIAKVPPTILKEALAHACHEIREAILEGGGISKPPAALSGGMVYLLRYLDTRGYSVTELTPALLHFQTRQRNASLTDPEKRAWRKATQYACQCLRSLGLAETYDGDRYYRISERGRRLLYSQGLHKIYAEEVKLKKIRLARSRD